MISATDAWAVSALQLSYHWDGSNWTAITLPAVPTDTNTLEYAAVDGNVSNDVWAVGYSIRHSDLHSFNRVIHWNGSTWTVVTVPNPGSNLNQLNSIKVISSNDAWAVGWASNGGGVDFTVTLHWDGSAWTQVTSPNDGSTFNDLKAVDGIASNDVWAVGGAGDLLYAPLALHWNGAVWTSFPMPGTDTYNILYGVSMVSATDAWAVGETGVNGPSRSWAAHWNGATWTEVAVPTIGTFDRLTATKVVAGEVYAAGSYYNGRLLSRILHWNGAGWDQIATANPGTDAKLVSIDGVSGDTNIWAVGDYTDQSSNFSLIERACAPATPTTTATITPTVINTTTATSVTTQTPTSSVTPSATPTIGNYCAYIAWTDRVNTAIDNNGHLKKVGGIDGHWDAGAVSTLGITSAPACYRVDPGSVSLGTEQVVGLSHHETSASYSDIDFGIYLGITGTLGVVDGGQLITGTFGTYAAGDELNISIEGDPLVANFYHNQHLFYTSPSTPQLPLFADTSISTINGSISPGRICSNGPGGTPTATPTFCPANFSDVTDPAAYYYQPVMYLACHGVVGGYADGTYRPFNNTTRGQMAKIVVGAFALPIQTPAGGAYTFTDAPPGSTFFSYVETAAVRGIISGYPCGGSNPQTGQVETCDGGSRPYYRSNNNVSRGQLTKIVAIGAGWPTSNPAAATFIDVPPGSTFYTFIEAAACRGIIGGYNDGSFRPSAGAFRGQIAKIVTGAVTVQGECPFAATP